MILGEYEEEVAELFASGDDFFSSRLNSLFWALTNQYYVRYRSALESLACSFSLNSEQLTHASIEFSLSHFGVGWRVLNDQAIGAGLDREFVVAYRAEWKVHQP